MKESIIVMLTWIAMKLKAIPILVYGYTRWFIEWVFGPYISKGSKWLRIVVLFGLIQGLGILLGANPAVWIITKASEIIDIQIDL